MRFLLPAVVVAVVFSSVPALSQTCKDIPRLKEMIRAGVEKMKTNGPSDAALRQFGSICPPVRKAHGAVHGIIRAAEKDPGRCGGTPEQLAKLRELAQFLDLHSDCGTPQL